MKVVIPVAGFGSRLRPHTNTTPKVLLPVAGKPILGHILDRVKSLDVSEVIFVVGYMGDKIKGYVDSEYEFKTKFVKQKEMLGLGHAISLAAPYFGNEPLLIILGDTVFDADLSKLTSEKESALCVKKVADPSRFGVAVVKNSYISKLVEKPETPISKLALVGIYFIKESQVLKKSLEKLIKQNKKTKNEYQLTDALEMMVSGKTKIKVFSIDGWLDCGKPETLLETNRYLLKNAKSANSSVRYSNTLIIPPVFIGENVKIKKSIIGPYVSVSSGTKIAGAIISNSTVGCDSDISNCVLDKSIVGNNVKIKGKIQEINIGDYSSIKI